MNMSEAHTIERPTTGFRGEAASALTLPTHEKRARAVIIPED